MKPSGIDLNLKYECPKCGEELWATFQEVHTPGFIIVCSCSNVLKIKTISKVDCIFKYKDEDKQEVRRALLALGFNENEFTVPLSRATGTPDEMLKQVMRQIQ